MAVSQAEPSAAVLAAQSFIDGRWVDGSGETVERRNPASQTVVSTVSYGSAADVDAAVKAASRAQRDWAAVPIATRCERLQTVADLLEDRFEDLARMTTAETGKTLQESRGELIGTIKYFRIIPEDALRFHGQVVSPTFNVSKNKRVLVVPVPVGVAAVLTPWNFPTAVPAEGFVAGLALGNAVLWKPSEVTPGTAHMLVQTINEAANLPPGVFSLLQGGGETGAALVSHDKVGLVHFTGSTATGERIARSVGVKRLLLELGGNGPVVVMDDADLDSAVEGVIRSALLVAGQCCTAAERVLVHRDVYDEFAERLVQRIERMKVGDPFDETTEMGPCTIQSSVDKTQDHIRDAVAKGATVATGGKVNGLFHDPTVVTGVTSAMEVAQEETFGPIIPLIRISNEKEGIEIANETKYGLQASVYTRDLTKGWRMAELIDCGTVLVNEMTNYWEFLAPFGGMKQSGVGRVSGTGALEAYSNQKQITLDLG